MSGDNISILSGLTGITNTASSISSVKTLFVATGDSTGIEYISSLTVPKNLGATNFRNDIFLSFIFHGVLIKDTCLSTISSTASSPI